MPILMPRNSSLDSFAESLGIQSLRETVGSACIGIVSDDLGPATCTGCTDACCSAVIAGSPGLPVVPAQKEPQYPAGKLRELMLWLHLCSFAESRRGWQINSFCST